MSTPLTSCTVTPAFSRPVSPPASPDVRDDATIVFQLPADDTQCPRSDSDLCVKEVDLEEVGEKRLASPDDRPPAVRRTNRTVILILLSSAQFFDIVNACSSIAALPQISDSLSFAPGVSQWVLSAYALTLGSFQLVGGRMTDIYDPKTVFVAGYVTLGIVGIACGFSVQPIMLIVFRALQGIGAAMTIPSAVAMITVAFPEPKAQANALAVFGGAGAVGNCVGFVIGGIITAKASWRWVFWVVSIIVLPFSAVSYFALPRGSPLSGGRRSLDLPGVGVLTAGLILFVYGLSAANQAGWATAQILVPLILSVFVIISFFFVERIVKDPAVPPRTWTNKSFIPLVIVALSIYWHFMGNVFQLVNVYQDLWGWGPLSAAIHSLPIGTAGGISCVITGIYGHLIPRKMLLVGGEVLMAIGTALYALADSPDKYWSHIVPGNFIAMFGLSAAYVGVIVAVMANARKGEEGVAGALTNTSYQLGAAIGLAIVTAVTLGVDDREPADPVSQFKGYAASFWSVLAMHGVMTVICLFIKEGNEEHV